MALPRILSVISAAHVASAPAPGGGFDSLQFQLDSPLLVVLGAPLEDEVRDGTTMLEWNGTALRTLRFIARDTRCPA